MVFGCLKCISEAVVLLPSHIPYRKDIDIMKSMSLSSAKNHGLLAIGLDNVVSFVAVSQSDQGVNHHSFLNMAPHLALTLIQQLWV